MVRAVFRPPVPGPTDRREPGMAARVLCQSALILAKRRIGFPPPDLTAAAKTRGADGVVRAPRTPFGACRPHQRLILRPSRIITRPTPWARETLFALTRMD
jgi:hypothetical protein